MFSFKNNEKDRNAKTFSVIVKMSNETRLRLLTFHKPNSAYIL